MNEILNYTLEIRANGDSMDISDSMSTENFNSIQDALSDIEEAAHNNLYINATASDEDEDEYEYTQTEYNVSVEIRYLSDSFTTTLPVDAWSKNEAEQVAESIIRDGLFLCASAN